MFKQLYRFLNPRFQNLFLDYKVKMEPRYGHGKPPHKELYDIVHAGRNTYVEWLNKMLLHIENIAQIKDIKEEKDAVQPVWNNGFLPGLDIIAIYSILSTLKPRKYIEVGSGNSTKVAYKAKKEHNPSMEIISIDPMPRAEVDGISDKVIREVFEHTDMLFINELQKGDVLFIDNSHRILPNSDAMVFFMEVLPKLNKGVIVHVHDIYLPYDYPQFMCDRAYSEQYGLAFYLLANPQRYKTLFPCYYISVDKELSDMLKPFWEQSNLKNVEKHGCSYWFEIN